MEARALEVFLSRSTYKCVRISSDPSDWVWGSLWDKGDEQVWC